jgi:hypothetical protein
VHTDTILNWALGFAAVWFAVAAAHAFWMARDAKHDPLPPEPIEHHGRGHHDHDVHGAAHHA